MTFETDSNKIRSMAILMTTIWVEIRLSNYIQIRLHTRSKCSQITFNNDASTLVCSKRRHAKIFSEKRLFAVLRKINTSRIKHPAPDLSRLCLS